MEGRREPILFGAKPPGLTDLTVPGETSTVDAPFDAFGQ